MPKKSETIVADIETPSAPLHQDMPAGPDKLITVQELAAMLGVSTTCCFNWNSAKPKNTTRPKGFPAGIALGDRRTRWRMSEVQAFIAQAGLATARPHHLRERPRNAA